MWIDERYATRRAFLREHRASASGRSALAHLLREEGLLANPGEARWPRTCR